MPSISLGGAAAAATIAIAALLWPAMLAAAVPGRVPDARATIERAFALGRSGECRGVLGLLDPLVGGLPEGEDRIDAQLLRMPCLGATGRGGEVAPVQAELARAVPDNALVQGFGVFVAADAGRYPQAADALATLADRHPDTLAMLPSDLWRALAQKLTEAGDVARRDRVEVALARADWQPVDRPELRETIAESAAAVLARQKDVDGARALLPRITMPELLVDMGVDRGFAALWPDVEARLGAHGQAAVNRFAAVKLYGWAGDPNDPRTRRDAIRAYIMLGRFADAAATARPVAVAAGMSEDDVAAVRYAAQALDAGGDRAAAIARLEPFATLDLAATPAAAGGIVALADLLQEAGRAAEALAVTRLADTRGGDALSAWGRAQVASSAACALGQLGRAAEARAAADRLLAGSRDNAPATIEALLCGGRDEEAARLAIATLGAPDGADRLADRFQPERAGWAPAPSRLRGAWQRLLARADVRAAFDRAARILPETLWPVPGEQPVPRAPGAVPDASTT